MFVCVEFLRPSQPNGVMSSVVSLPNHTFTRKIFHDQISMKECWQGSNPRPPGLQSDAHPTEPPRLAGGVVRPSKKKKKKKNRASAQRAVS